MTLRDISISNNNRRQTLDPRLLNQVSIKSQSLARYPKIISTNHWLLIVSFHRHLHQRERGSGLTRASVRLLMRTQISTAQELKCSGIALPNWPLIRFIKPPSATRILLLCSIYRSIPMLKIFTIKRKIAVLTMALFCKLIATSLVEALSRALMENIGHPQ